MQTYLSVAIGTSYVQTVDVRQTNEHSSTTKLMHTMTAKQRDPRDMLQDMRNDSKTLAVSTTQGTVQHIDTG